MNREWWGAGAASAAVAAAALTALIALAGPASASTPDTAGGCKLGALLCAILGGGKPATPSPTPSPTHSAPAPSPKPPTKARPRPRPSETRARSRTAAGSGSAPAPLTPGFATFAPPTQAETPFALPNVPAMNPQAPPEVAPQIPSTRLVAAVGPSVGALPPALVATASGLIGAVAAINLSMLQRGRRRVST